MTKRRWHWTAIALVAAVACDSGEREAAAPRDSASTPPMAGMPGMAHGGATPSTAMMSEMRAHMRTLDDAGPDSLQRLMPGHRQRAANMLQQMDAEMRQMQMPGDSAWEALTDSVRQDLTRLPEITRQELPAFMEAHSARLQRLMDRHDAMMGQVR